LNWAVRDNKIEPQRVIVDQFHASSGKKNIRLTTDPAIGRETTQFDPSPFLVPPTWNKGDHYVSIQPVWRAAAQELAQAHNIFVVGFSMPDTDSFFHYLYALGAESLEQLQRFFVFNPDEKVMGRFKRLLGPGALDRFKPYFRDKEGRFENAVVTMARELGVSF
jgi:hypothetical protein